MHQPPAPPDRAWSYSTTMGRVQRITADSCEIAEGRVTWLDVHGAIVWSEVSANVHGLQGEHAQGSATGRRDPVKPDACPWCQRALEGQAAADLSPTGHVWGCPHG